MLVVIMFVIGESEGVPEGIVNDVCGLCAVPLGKAEGESEELRVGPIDGCAAGFVDGRSNSLSSLSSSRSGFFQAKLHIGNFPNSYLLPIYMYL